MYQNLLPLWRTNEELMITAWEGLGFTNNYNLRRNSYVKGSRHFELSNHTSTLLSAGLGNVLTVVSDRKIEHDERYAFAQGGGYKYENGTYHLDASGSFAQISASDGIISSYTAEQISATDYYAFGAPLPGRTWQGGEYRFGFNGQERDDEVAGAGNTMTAEFWEYDARLGRRWNLDPKPDASISSYSCFRNNPLLFSDVDGDTVKYGGLMDKLNAGIGRVFSREFREKFNRWDASTENYTIIKDRYAVQNLENASPNYQLSPSDENENTVRYNSGIGFDDVSSTTLRTVFGAIRIPLSVTKLTLSLPLGVISGLTGQRIPWGAGDKIYAGEKGNGLLLFGWGFGQYNKYNWHFGAQKNKRIYPDDGLIGFRFGFSKLHPPNFIDIAHRNKYGIHLHLNLVFPEQAARNKFLHESIIDFSNRK